MYHFQGRSFTTVVAEAALLGRAERDAWVLSFALFMQALAALECGDYQQAAALSREAIDAANTCDDEVQGAGPRLVLANIAVQDGDEERAQQLYDEAIAIERRAGEIWGLSIILSAAAGLRIVRHDFNGARAQASEALSLSRNSKIHAGWPGASTCSLGCRPPADTRTEPPDCGAPPTGCWKA